MKTRVFSGSNPSLMYLQSFNELIVNGEECAPRGKKIKELRPAVFEFEIPSRIPAWTVIRLFRASER